MYSYKDALINDIKNNLPKNELDDCATEEEMINCIVSLLYDDGNVTGNGWHYYASEETCMSYLSGNENLFYEAIEWFNIETIPEDILKERMFFRWCDCTIRCFLFYSAARVVANEIINGRKT